MLLTTKKKNHHFWIVYKFLKSQIAFFSDSSSTSALVQLVITLRLVAGNTHISNILIWGMQSFAPPILFTDCRAIEYIKDRQSYSRSRIPPAFCCCRTRPVRWARLLASVSSSYPASRWRRSWPSEDLKTSPDMVRWSSWTFHNNSINLNFVIWQLFPL